MLYERLRHFKYYYIDTVDPERTVAKTAFRTALACAISIFLFQLIGNVTTSAWAGFAAFAFVQNDIQDSSVKRFKFLLSVIVIFTFLAFLGMLISNSLTLLLATLPFIIFICAFPACLGFNYFSASGWALFVYILATNSPSNIHHAMQLAGAFLICGAISLLCCFLIFPTQPAKKLLQSYQRILTKALLLLQSDSLKNKKDNLKYNTQLDQLLAIQEKNLDIYIETENPSSRRKNTLTALAKILYQFSLMTKSTVSSRQQAICHPSYLTTQLTEYNQLIVKLIKSILLQVKSGRAPNFGLIRQKLLLCQEGLINLRNKELETNNPNFSQLIDYSNYSYHFIKLFELLETTSQHLSNLKAIS
jgi:hypothetical protein